MELTDVIRNKHFDYILDTHLWKTSDEYTALAALKFCYGEKYKDLIVRLWGVSAHFVDLPRELQDEMIARFS